ncbi:hypothetical protein PT2222_290028 [Paraburkholderia tropica]
MALSRVTRASTSAPCFGSKLTGRLSDFAAKEAREIGGIREAEPERNLLDRHIAENEFALRFGNNARVNHFSRALFFRGGARGAQLHQRNREHRRVVLKRQIAAVMLVDQFAKTLDEAHVVARHAVVRGRFEARGANQRQQQHREQGFGARDLADRIRFDFVFQALNDGVDFVGGIAAMNERNHARRGPECDELAQLRVDLCEPGHFDRDDPAVDIDLVVESVDAVGGHDQRAGAFKRHAAAFEIHHAAAVAHEDQLPVARMRVRLGAPAPAFGHVTDVHEPVFFFALLDIEPDFGNRADAALVGWEARGVTDYYAVGHAVS